jgi:tetrahydromethanopterin S-methyltransferase subunit B
MAKKVRVRKHENIDGVNSLTISTERVEDMNRIVEDMMHILGETTTKMNIHMEYEDKYYTAIVTW